MSNELVLAKRESFGNVTCDFYKRGKEVFMTRTQIGEALGYVDPRVAIAKIHDRNKARMDKFSTVTKMGTVENGREIEREVYLYSARGVYEICRYSTQEKANDFYDFVYEILEGLRKGELKITQTSAEAAQKIAAYCRNAETRQMKFKYEALLRIKAEFAQWLSPESLQLLASSATEIVAGTPLIAKPQANKTYTATEIANELGISANRVGRLAEEFQLKNDENGYWIIDKAAYSDKQVKNYIYNENGRTKIKEALEKTSGVTTKRFVA